MKHEEQMRREKENMSRESIFEVVHNDDLPVSSCLLKLLAANVRPEGAYYPISRN
jgi:hypothetical protein